MTENKRFEIKPSAMYNNKYVIHDSKKEYTFPVLDSTLNYMFCKALNELHDENQLLPKINEDAIDFMYDNFDLNIIFTDRELNDICNDMGWELSEKGIKIKQLEKENEELKQYKQSVNDVLKSWSQKNLTAKQLQVVLAIMEELNVIGDV